MSDDHTNKHQWAMLGLRLLTLACGAVILRTHARWIVVLAIMGVAGASYAAGMLDGERSRRD